MRFYKADHVLKHMATIGSSLRDGGLPGDHSYAIGRTCSGSLRAMGRLPAGDTAD